MVNVVNNLQSKSYLKYLDVRTRLLELAFSSIVDTPKKNKPLSTKSKGKNQQSITHQQPNPTRVGKTVPAKGNQYSWWKSHNFPFHGHAFKTCLKLKDYQASSSYSQQRATQTTGREVVPYRASTAQELFSFNSLAHLVISRPSSHSTSVNVPAQVSTNYTTYQVWIFDTGACYHITADFSHLQNPVHCHVGLTVGGGRVMHATYQRNVVLSLEVPTGVLSLTLIDILYVPNWNEACLISWRKFDETGLFYMFGKDGIISVKMNSDNSVVLQATLEHGTYQVFSIVQHGQIYITSTDFWHQALGQSSTRYWSNAKDIYANGDILPKRPSHFWCSQYATYNSKEQALKPVDGPWSKELFDLVHTDVMGPFKVESIGRKKYLISLIDDFTRYMELNFVFMKSDTSRVLQIFCEKINTQTKRYSRSFRSDQGGEYINTELTDYFESKGIQYLVTAAYSPESNGVAERYNQTLTNIVRHYLDNVPASLWAEVFNWACYVKNRLPHSALMDKTLCEVLFNKKPMISHLRPFYAKCSVDIPEEK